MVFINVKKNSHYLLSRSDLYHMTCVSVCGHCIHTIPHMHKVYSQQTFKQNWTIKDSEKMVGIGESLYTVIYFIMNQLFSKSQYFGLVWFLQEKSIKSIGRHQLRINALLFFCSTTILLRTIYIVYYKSILASHTRVAKEKLVLGAIRTTATAKEYHTVCVELTPKVVLEAQSWKTFRTQTTSIPTATASKQQQSASIKQYHYST